MTRLLVDTSVLIKWFHQDGESEVEEARAICAAHVRGDLDAHILDLAVYEVGSVLIRALRWAADDVADQLDDVLVIVGAPLAMTFVQLRQAAVLAEAHTLSFNDACWAATAATLDISLVSADRRLLAAGLAESPANCAGRLQLG